VTLRKVPGALALGLLTSLSAHAALYGNGHVMGGAYHGLLIQAALAGAVGLALFFGALAWDGSRSVADGTVLGARLRERLPNIGVLLISASGWYAITEAVEPHHADSAPLVTIGAIVLIASLVLKASRTVVDVLADAVIAVLHAAFISRTPSWNRRPQSRPVLRKIALVRRRFARPPPIAIARA